MEVLSVIVDAVDVFFADWLQAAKDKIQTGKNIAEKLLNIVFML